MGRRRGEDLLPSGPMQRPEGSAPRRPTRGRRLAYAGLALVLSLGLLELFAGALLSTWAGHPVGLASLRTQRNAILGDQVGVQATKVGESDEEDEVSQWALRLQEREVLHPYIGFVEDPQGAHLRNIKRFDPEAIDFGFPRNRHRLFHQPSDDVVVVAVVGGSVSRQVSFGAQERLERGLEGIPRFRGRRVEVLSLGLGGHKQPQQVMVFNYFLALGMHIDLLVNIDGFNEVTLPVTDNLASGVSPFYPRIWGYRVGDIDTEERRVRGQIELLRDLRREVALAFERTPWRWSLTCGLVWRLADGNLVNRTAAAEQRMLERGPRDMEYQARGPAYEAVSTEALYRDLAAVWARCSLQLHQLARARGIEYYHFLQPNQYDEGSKPLTSRELRGAYARQSPFRHTVLAGYPALRTAAEELRHEGVAFTDLSGLFAATRDDVYVDTCCHMNERGVGMMVDRIVAAVAAERADGLRPSGPSDRSLP